MRIPEIFRLQLVSIFHLLYVSPGKATYRQHGIIVIFRSHFEQVVLLTIGETPIERGFIRLNFLNSGTLEIEAEKKPNVNNYPNALYVILKEAIAILANTSSNQPQRMRPISIIRNTPSHLN
jgi:hypothetical protein